MKIAYLINHIGQTGVNLVVRDLVGQMVAHGHECEVMYLEDGRQKGETVSFSCKVTRLTDVKQLDDYDIVHTHGMKPELYAARHLWLRKHSYKLITTLHCYCFQDFTDLYGTLKGWLMGVVYVLLKYCFDRVVCLSKDMMDYYSRWIPRKRLSFVYNTRVVDPLKMMLDDDERKEILDFKKDGFVIGMNGVLLYRKGVDVMLRALALLPDCYRLFLVGDGKEKDVFIKMIEDLNLKERVMMVGSKKDACRYLPYYDIYATPSRSEGFPLVLLEAAAFGKCVVASRLPVVTECFDDDEVVTFDMPDERALANAIVKANEMMDLGRNLRKKFEEHFAPERFYQKYVEVYGIARLCR